MKNLFKIYIIFFIFTSISFSQQITKFDPIYYSPHYSQNSALIFRPIAFLDSNHFISAVINTTLHKNEDMLRYNPEFGSFVGMFVIKTTDGGLNWNLIKKDIPKYINPMLGPIANVDIAFETKGVSYPSNNTLLYYGMYKKYDSIYHYVDPWLARIVVSKDGGDTWKEHSPGNQKDGSSCMDLQMINENEGYCILVNSNKENKSYDIYQTYDCWDNYQLVLSLDMVASLFPLKALFCDTSGYVQVLYNSKIYYSNNKGKNWDSLEIKFNFEKSNFFIRELKMINKDVGIFLLHDNNLKEGDSLYNRLLITYDGFKTYKDIPLDFDVVSLKSFAAITDQDILVIGPIKYKGISFFSMKTTDQGKHWELIHLPVNGDPSTIIFADYIDTNKIFIAGKLNGEGNYDAEGTKGIYFRNYGKTTLMPPVPLHNNQISNYILDSTTAIFNWEKIEGADSYKITIDGKYNEEFLKYPPISKFPTKMRNETKLFIETKDTFIVVKDLWYRCSYQVSASSYSYIKSDEIPAQESEVVKIYSFRNPIGYLETPQIIEPSSSTKFFYDSIKIIWNKVDRATGYDLVINKYYPDIMVGNTQVVYTNYTDTSYVLYEVRENVRAIYTIILGAVSENDHSYFTTKYELYNYDPIGVKEYEVSDSYLYPNPVTDYAKVKIDSKFNGLVNVSIMDMQGNSEYLGNYNLDETNHFVELNFSKYSRGLYTLLLDYGKNREVVKMIKE